MAFAFNSDEFSEEDSMGADGHAASGRQTDARLTKCQTDTEHGNQSLVNSFP